MAQPNQGNQQGGDRDTPRDQNQGGSQNPDGQQGAQEGQRGDSERNRDRNQGGSQGDKSSQANNQRERNPSSRGQNQGGQSGPGGMNR
jgi:hypothetical protein